MKMEISDVNSSDYPDFSDAHISYAEYEDTGKELTEDELVQLTEENYDYISEMAMEECVCASEAIYDAARGH